MDIIKPLAKLEDWFVGDNDQLIGIVFGHPKISDGTEIRTTRVVTWDKDNKRAITKNTEYVLGTPRKEQ